VSRHTRGQRGQAMIEFGLVAPLLFFLIFGIVEGGTAVFAAESAHFAAHDAALAVALAGTDANADKDGLAKIQQSFVGTTSVVTVDYVDVDVLVPDTQCNPKVLGGNRYTLDGHSIASPNGAWPVGVSRSNGAGSGWLVQVSVQYHYPFRVGFLGDRPLTQTATAIAPMPPTGAVPPPSTGC